MISQNILEEASKLIGGDRKDDYGDKLTNHQNIAALWSIFLQRNITPHDVAMCMALVKVARLIHSHKKDSYLDLAAYAAIAGEIEARTNKDNISFESEGERRGRMTDIAIKKWHEDRKKK
tara:strand:+ start:2401 stop:2760 length:360 start_codon:yes stop_codon:yes gene_type:complete